MADIAPKLVELSADKLRSLHERLHKSEATPASLEVHHHTTSEMARRGMELGEDDWAQFEIEIDYLKDIDLSSLGSSLPEGLVEEVIKETGSSIGNVRTVLTIGGYALRIVPVEDDSVNKMIRQSKEGWTVYDHTGTRKFGTYGSKKEAEDRLSQIHRFSKAADYTPPKGVRVAARRALDWISEGKAGGGFTSVGRNRAQQLSAGENISLDTLKRMKAFFSRHEVDKEALGFSQGEKGYPSPGRVAWDAWGGDAGFSWAESTISEAENALEKHLQGQHDQQSHAPQYARKMADSIIAGEHPSVGQKDVGPLFHGFAKLDDHPDITELKVEGTMMFGDEGMGIARKDMPQIPSKERDNFLSDIEKSDGITFEKEKIDPTTLKPIQKEVSGSRAGKIYDKYNDEGDIPKSERILISKDGYVVDGHHTWAASVAFAFDKPGTELPVYRLSVNAKEALAVSLKWAKDNGYEGQALNAPTKKALIWQSLEKHGNHDQSTHGSWANGNSAGLSESERRAAAIASGRIPGLPRDAQGRVANPDATGGYKAGIPEAVEFAGHTYTPNDSLWHHLVPDGKGGFEPSEERAYLHAQIIAKATSGVPQSNNPTFTMLGGGPASGKTTVIKSGLVDVPGPREAVHVNADDVKAMLPENARMTNSKNDGDFFSAAAFSHEESSILAKRIQSRAIKSRQDVVLDGTGDSDINKLASKVNEARSSGYKVNGLYVTVPTDTAWARAAARATGSSKRFVPESVVRSTHADVSRTFPKAIAAGLFDKVTLADNSGTTVKLIGTGTGSNFTVTDQGAYDAFIAKGK